MKTYVTVTDNFMTGWGHAKGKISKMVIECDTNTQAYELYNNMIDDNNLSYVNICSNKPYYNKQTHHTSHKHYDEMIAYHN